MNNLQKNTGNYAGMPVILDMRDCYTCSFTEFYPFCVSLYYFSSFKAFGNNTGN